MDQSCSEKKKKLKIPAVPAQQLSKFFDSEMGDVFAEACLCSEFKAHFGAVRLVLSEEKRGYPPPPRLCASNTLQWEENV